MSNPIALISSVDIPQDELLALIAEMDGVVTHTTPFFSFRISRGWNHLWVAVESKELANLEKERLDFVARKLDAQPRNCLIIEMSSASGSRQLAVEFAVQFAMRWNCVIYNFGNKVFKLQELLALKDIQGEFFDAPYEDLSRKTQRYKYVGPRSLRELLDKPTERHRVRRVDDIRKWVTATQQRLTADKTVVATFIIDTQRQLWINDRHSEHIVCAAGEDVLSAGEMTFALRQNEVEVVEVTNQSTGYCPEPESWWAVESALERIGFTHPENFIYPDDFTTAFLFRRCDGCETINIVKDMWFECGVCQKPLSERWNFE